MWIEVTPEIAAAVKVYREYAQCMHEGEDPPDESLDAALCLSYAVSSAYRDDDAEPVLLERLVGLGWEDIGDDEFPVYASPKSKHAEMPTRTSSGAFLNASVDGMSVRGSEATNQSISPRRWASCGRCVVDSGSKWGMSHER